jgi:hypothetical protein
MEVQVKNGGQFPCFYHMVLLNLSHVLELATTLQEIQVAKTDFAPIQNAMNQVTDIKEKLKILCEYANTKSGQQLFVMKDYEKHV